jgi:hypothetical protein
MKQSLLGHQNCSKRINVDEETIRQIITNNFNMRKVCTMTVPKNLKEEQKLQRKEICVNMLEKVIQDLDFLGSMVICDGTGCFNMT